jgi:hypothetical protein
MSSSPFQRWEIAGFARSPWYQFREADQYPTINFENGDIAKVQGIARRNKLSIELWAIRPMNRYFCDLDLVHPVRFLNSVIPSRDDMGSG